MMRYRPPQDTQCLQPGFESFYQVPGSCDNLADRLQDACGVTAEQVMQVSNLHRFPDRQMSGLPAQLDASLATDTLGQRKCR